MGEFLAWFGTDADCRDFLAWLRWPGGFVCGECGHAGGWQLADGRWECGGCSHRTSVTAGTVFDRTRTPLTVWFHACWSFATAKDGVSALSLQRTLQIGSYQTAWAILHRLRSVLIRPGRELLAGHVEVDETYIGGEEAGLAGGRAKGKKALVAVAVEVKSPQGFGRCRMRVIPDGSASTLHAFVKDNIAAGSTVVTDGWNGYLGIDKVGYDHDRRSQRAAKALGEDIDKLLPGVHRVASLAKRWLLSTHQGAVEVEHLPGYLDEFCFRFNRAAHATAAWCSTACSSWPSGTTRCATASSSKGTTHVPRPRALLGEPATRPASTGHGRRDPGGALTRPTPVKWRALTPVMHSSTTAPAGATR